METKIVKSLNEFSQCVEENQNIYYFLEKVNGKISEYIENSGLEDDVLLNLKVSYDFKVDALLEDKRTKDKLKVNSIVEIVEKLKENEEEYYRVILKSNEKTLISDVIQQFIYLDMKSLDIVTEEELKQVLRYERLKENKEDLKSSIQEFKNRVISHKSDNKEIKKDKIDIEEKITELEHHLIDIEERPLKICVMATKKSGKSVIVNSFLEDEYAPTSMQLATPNTVIYESWDKDIIECKVEASEELKGYEKENIKEFSNSDEVKRHINTLFKYAEKDDKNRFSMPDIYIKYPKKNLEYTIIDTPGPDLAGSGHSKIAYRWIEEADAVIFAIDYSKYLTEGEETFLKDIKTKLQEKEKFHSLIIVVNKLDLRYDSNEKKSVVNFLDFLKRRLNILGYGDIPIMGITSLQYYSSLEFSKFIAKNHYNHNKEDILENSIYRELKDFPRTSSDKTYIGNIQKYVQSLDNHHDIYDVSLKDLEYYSGMPALIDRVKYITTTKASVEIFNNTFTKMDRSFKEITNNFLAIKIKQLLSQKKNIIDDLNEIDKFFKKKDKEINSIFNEELEEEVKKKLDVTFEEFSEDVKLVIASSLNDKKNKILEEEKVLSLSYEEIIQKLEKPLEKNINSSIVDINSLKNDYIDSMEKSVIQLNSDIQQKIKEKKFETKYNLKISLSKLEPKLAREKFAIQFDKIFSNLVLGGETIDVIEDKTITETKIKKEKRTRRGKQIDKWFQWFRDVEYETEHYKVDVEYQVEKNIKVVNKNKLDKKFKAIEEKLLKLVSYGIKQQEINAKKEVNDQLLKFDEIIKSELQQVIQSYKITNNNIKKMLDYSKSDIEEIESFYKSIHTDFIELNTIWTSIVEEK